MPDRPAGQDPANLDLPPARMQVMGEDVLQRVIAHLTALPDNQLEFYDPAQYGPQLSRGFPGSRIWLTVKFFGAARYRAALAEKRALAVWAADRIAAIPGVVMDAPPQLSLFAFHLESPTLRTPAARNATTHSLT